MSWFFAFLLLSLCCLALSLPQRPGKRVPCQPSWKTKFHKQSHVHFNNAALRSSFALNLGNLPWWEDELPNIFGINPLEAAVVFGALYYFYGPTTLYEYAREAGRLFSTYAPVVKDISLDIFYEFREYLEEDRERARLEKSGVDISRMPRRTTNVIERFQESLAVCSYCPYNISY